MLSNLQYLLHIKSHGVDIAQSGTEHLGAVVQYLCGGDGLRPLDDRLALLLTLLLAFLLGRHAHWTDKTVGGSNQDRWMDE